MNLRKILDTTEKSVTTEENLTLTNQRFFKEILCFLC